MACPFSADFPFFLAAFMPLDRILNSGSERQLTGAESGSNQAHEKIPYRDTRLD